MTKKDLLLLPSHACPKIKNLLNLPFVTKTERIKFLLTASIYELSDRKILKVTLFFESTRESAYLIFCDEDQGKFWSYDVSDRRWSSACLHNLVGGHAPMLSIANADDNVGAVYFKQKNRLTSNCILDFQFRVRETENCVSDGGIRMHVHKPISRQYENSPQFMDYIMQQVQPLPADIHQFIDAHVLTESRYFYYKREKAQLVGYCSHCQTTSTMPLPKEKGSLYNKAGKCPHCHSGIWFKPQGRACEIRTNGRMEYIQKISDGFLIRSFYVVCIIPKDYHKKFREYLEEDFRTFISYSGKKHEFYYYKSHFGREEWMHIDTKRAYYYGSPYCPGGALYTKNLNRIFKGTKYQYCQLAEFARHMKIVHSPTYLERYLDAPCIEYLVKLKMYRLLIDVVNKYNRYLKNPHGKNPAEVFGVPKADVKALVKLNVSGPELGIWRWLRENGRQFGEKDIRIIQSCDMKVENFEFIKQYFELCLPMLNLSLAHAQLIKYLSYLKKQLQGKHQPMSNIGFDWHDYIETCSKLKYDLTDENTLWPRDLTDAHDKVTALVKTQKNKKYNEAIQKRYLKILEKYAYHEKDFLVTVPSCADDLIAEGQMMNHCVATYLDRVAKNECTILFIRSTANPKKPLVTCEVRGNKAIQIRAKNNGVPSKEVMEFWERFKAKKLDKQSKNRKAG